MLRVSEGKAIAGFVPCPECQAVSVVHFPKGGKRMNTPYVSCFEHKSIQTAGMKAYVKSNVVDSLDNFALKHGVDVSAELEQISANKTPINNELLFRLDNEKIIEALPVIEVEEIQPEEVVEPEAVTVDESGEVLKEKPEPKETGSLMPVVIVVVMVLVVGGGLYFLTRKRSDSSEDEA